ncbi:MAG: iron-containing alcohol dehydrogenase [Thermovirgaceae bacterium]|nr:iron-containing alcohol dehydrogenase [Thermovirgaceae bacterium]
MGVIKPFSFELPTRIEFGAGVSSSVADVLKEMGKQRPLVVTDAGLMDAGIFDRVREHLERGGIRFEVFSSVEPNPKDVNVMEGASAAKEFGADCLIAIGGGSPIDCAKGIGIIATHGGKIRDYEGRNAVRSDTLPMIAIPTTSGTGSEVTFSSVITDTAERFKFSIRHPRLAARVALCDPELTASMPPMLTAATGMDALVHAIEGFTAVPAEPIADACALHAIEIIVNFLPRAVRSGEDMEARAGMLIGSVLAGISFSHSDVAAIHCIAEALGGMYDAPHGMCNAVALAPVMEFNMPYCVERYSRVAAAMGHSFKTAEEGAEKAVEHVAKLTREVGLPSFRLLGVREEDMEIIAENSAKNGSNSSNPRPMGKKEYLELLRKMG